MKKIITIASLLAFTLAANAQDVTVVNTTPSPDAKMYKPVAGDVLAEIGFLVGGIGANPTSLSPSPFSSPTNVIPQLKFRYFLADQLALRVGFNLTQNSSTEKIYGTDPDADKGYARNMNSLFGLNAGLEKHFTGTGRLSTYVGGDICFQRTGAATKWDNTANGTTFTDGATRKRVGLNDNGNRSSIGFGLRAVAGADYYFVDKVYLGAEFGWGFMAVKEGKVKDDLTIGGNTTHPDEAPSGGGSFALAPSLTAGLRLGFRF